MDVERSVVKIQTVQLVMHVWPGSGLIVPVEDLVFLLTCRCSEQMWVSSVAGPGSSLMSRLGLSRLIDVNENSLLVQLISSCGSCDLRLAVYSSSIDL